MNTKEVKLNEIWIFHMTPLTHRQTVAKEKWLWRLYPPISSRLNDARLLSSSEFISECIVPFRGLICFRSFAVCF